MMRFALVLVAVAAGLSMTMGHISLPSPRPSAAPVEVAETPSATTQTKLVTAVAGQELMLDRDDSGQFHVEGQINGQSIAFLVDTGADSVALTIDSARQAGFYVDPTGFETVGVGASGPVRGSRIKIARLDVAGRAIEDVDGLVLEGLATNLLGQNVLGRFGAVELSGDKMRIR